MNDPRIPALGDDDTPESVRAVFRQTQKAIGMVPNLHRTLAHAPAALQAYVGFAQALARGDLPAQLREKIAVACAAINGCAYCASAHTAIGKALGISSDELACNLGADSQDPEAAAVLRFVRVLIEQWGAVSDAEFEAVRAAGFDDAAIVEIAAHVGMNTFTNMFNVMARTTIDFPEVALTAAR